MARALLSNRPPPWRLHDLFPVRAAGLPYEWLERIRCSGSAEVAEQIVELEFELKSQLPGLLARVHRARSAATDPIAINSLRRLERRLKQLKPDTSAAVERHPDARCLRVRLVGWNDLAERLVRDLERGEQGWARETRAAEDELTALARDERFRSAVFLSSPSMSDAIDRFLLGDTRSRSRRRQIMLRLVRYLQRFCATNETAAHTGPIAYGRIDEGDACSLRVAGAVGSQPSTRRVSLAHWAADAVAAAWADEEEFAYERAIRRAALNAGVSQEQPSVDLQDVILAHADGRWSMRALATHIGEPVERLAEQAHELEQRGHVQLAFSVDSYSLEALSDLSLQLNAMEVRDGPAWNRWRRFVDRIEQVRTQFELSALAERRQLLAEAEALFARAVQQSPRRGAGRHYADRLLFYEDCEAPFGIVLGEPLAAALRADLLPGIDAAARPVLDAHAHAAATAQRVLSALLDSRNTNCISVEEALRAPDDGASDLAAADLARSPLVQVGEESEPESVEGRTPSFAGAGNTDPLFAAPDVMIAARDVKAIAAGDYRLVLGEIHHVLPLSSIPLMLFCPGREAVRQQLWTELCALTAPRLPSIVGLRRQTKGLDLVPLAGMIVIQDEWLGHAGEGESVALSDLVVCHDDDRRLSLRVGNRELRILPHYEDQGNPRLPDTLRAFALPPIEKRDVATGAHTPRIEIGKLVIQRERWEVAVDSLPTRDCRTFGDFVSIWRWKRTLLLPDQAFARTPSEPKPWHVDFRSPLSCAVFLRMIDNAEHVTLTEMLPGPNDLWLRGSEGRYTSEFRFTILRTS